MTKITWTFQAQEELSDIREYHLTTSETYANFLIDLIIDKVLYLEQFPKVGRILPEANISFLREIIVKNYRVIYSILPGDQVHILAIRHSSLPLDKFEI